MIKEDLLSLFNKEKVDKLYHLMDSTLSMNEKFNLTAITDKDKFLELMIYDSIVPSTHVDFNNKKILDVGTGAGFPGIPLAIVTNGNFDLLDSTKKKINYINDYVKNNGINNVKGFCDRAEVFANTHRETYDYVIARAVASLPILLELCIPMVKVCGCFLAMKSNKADEEIKLSEKALKKLDCEIIECFNDVLPTSKETRTLIVIKKNKPTNKKYPRTFDQIKTKTL